MLLGIVGIAVDRPRWPAVVTTALAGLGALAIFAPLILFLLC